MKTLEQLLTAYDHFCDALTHVEGLDVGFRVVQPSTDADITKVEGLVGVRVPDDLRTFWKRGFRNLSVSLGNAGVARATCVDAKGSMAQAKIALSVAKTCRDATMLRWLEHGIPFQEDETYCFIDGGKGGASAVRQMIFDGDPTEEPVASSFTEFFEAWLAAGCFDDGRADLPLFKRYWAKVSPLVPIATAPENNAWLSHLGRFHGKAKFFGSKKAPSKAKKPVKATEVSHELADDPTTLWLDAAWHVRKKRLDTAMACIAKAIELDPSQASAIAKDTDLRPLHKNEEFRRLVGISK